MKTYTVYGDDETDLFDAPTFEEAIAWLKGYTADGLSGWSFITIRHPSHECLCDVEMTPEGYEWTHYWN